MHDSVRLFLLALARTLADHPDPHAFADSIEANIPIREAGNAVELLDRVLLEEQARLLVDALRELMQEPEPSP